MNKRVGQLLVGAAVFVVSIGTGAAATADDLVTPGQLDELVAVHAGDGGGGDCTLDGECNSKAVFESSIVDSVEDCLDGCDPRTPLDGIMCAGAGLGRISSSACVPLGTP